MAVHVSSSRFISFAGGSGYLTLAFRKATFLWKGYPDSEGRIVRAGFERFSGNSKYLVIYRRSIRKFHDEI